MENRREYTDKMAAKLRELDNQIKELEGIAELAVAEVHAEYQQQIEELFLKKEAVQNILMKIKGVSGNAWEDMKAGVGLSWEAFNESVKMHLRK